MLSPKTQYNLKNVQEYFEEHLCAGDYYSEGAKIRGQWFGKGAGHSDCMAMWGAMDFSRCAGIIIRKPANR